MAQVVFDRMAIGLAVKGADSSLRCPDPGRSCGGFGKVSLGV